MAIVLMDKGSESVLKAWLNNVWAGGGKDLTMKLFTNNYTPVRGSLVGNFTEASGGNYAAKTIANGSWVVSGVSTPRNAAFAQQQWTFNGPLSGNATIYGYYMVDADGVAVFAELLAAPFQPANNGDILQITPNFAESLGTPA